VGSELFDIILLGLLAGWVVFRLYWVFCRRADDGRVLSKVDGWLRALALILILGLVALALLVTMPAHATPGMLIGLVAGCILVPTGLLLMANWSVWASPSKRPAAPSDNQNKNV